VDLAPLLRLLENRFTYLEATIDDVSRIAFLLRERFVRLNERESRARAIDVHPFPFHDKCKGSLGKDRRRVAWISDLRINKSTR